MVHKTAYCCWTEYLYEYTGIGPMTGTQGIILPYKHMYVSYYIIRGTTAINTQVGLGTGLAALSTARFYRWQ